MVLGGFEIGVSQQIDFVDCDLGDGYVCDGGAVWDNNGDISAASYTYNLIGDGYSTDSYKLRYRSFLKFDITTVDVDNSPFLLQIYLYGMDLPDGFTRAQGAALLGDAVVDLIPDYGTLDISDYQLSTDQFLSTIISASSDLSNGWYELDVTQQVQGAKARGDTIICFRIRYATDGPPDPPVDRTYEDCTSTSQAKYKINTADSPNTPRLTFTKTNGNGDLPPRQYTPKLRGLFFHSSDVPPGGRLADPSYYGPYLDMVTDTLHSNWLQVSLWYIEITDPRWIASATVPHCLESVEEVKSFIVEANARGIEVSIRLFDYPYGGGIWSDWDDAGYFDLSNAEVLSSQLLWLQYYIEGLKDANVYSFIVKNEPYWKYETPPWEVNEHIHAWTVFMAGKVKEFDPEVRVTFGSLHPYRQWSAPLDWSDPTSHETVTSFNVIDFHYYGPQDPFQSWGDPETVSPLKCIQTMVDYGLLWNRRVYLGEFGYWDHKISGQDGNITLRIQQYEEVLSACERYPIEGVTSWGFPYRAGYRWNLLNADGTLSEVGEKLVEYYLQWESDGPEPKDLSIILVVALLLVLTVVVVKRRKSG